MTALAPGVPDQPGATVPLLTLGDLSLSFGGLRALSAARPGLWPTGRS